MCDVLMFWAVQIASPFTWVQGVCFHTGVLVQVTAHSAGFPCVDAYMEGVYIFGLVYHTRLLSEGNR